MDEIAAAAGITKPMLYRYFGSKEGLYAAYLRMTGRELIERVRRGGSVGRSPEARLNAGLRGFLIYVSEHQTGWRVLHGASAPTDAAIAREVAGLRQRVVRLLTILFADEAFAHAFTGAAESVATWWIEDPHRSIDQATDCLLGIAAAGRPALRGSLVD